jgi:alpha-ketoglutarate-dependent sulfate ester dioxygenase
MANVENESGVRVHPVAGHIGAEIRGVSLAGPVSDAAVRDIRKALLQWKVIFFRDQQIGHAEQVAFTSRFGQVTYAHPLEDEPNSDHPEILAIDRRRYDRKDGRRYTYESRWHTDVTAVVNPPAGSILRAVNVPEIGGDTTWTNLVAAYEGLSAPLRTLADGLKAEHRFNARQRFKESENPYVKRVAANPQVSVHPVVRVHPETGERALFVSPGFTSHILELSQRESETLLELFFEQITKPAYTVRFRWNPGDVAFWDNRATAHLGPQDLDHLDLERVLYRTTLVGDIPVGVDGFRSQLIQGQPFGVEVSPVAKKSDQQAPTIQA